MEKKLILSLVFLLVSCGGGSDNKKSDAPPPAPKTYSLKKLNSLAPGLSYSVRLNGRSESGAEFPGSFSITNQAEENLNGVMVTPRFVSFGYASHYGGSGEIYAPKVDKYFVETATGNLIEIQEGFSDVKCKSSSPYHMPDSVKVGDADSAATLLCSDNRSIESTWRVDDAGNGLANLIIRRAKDDYESYTLDVDGNIIAFKKVLGTYAFNSIN